MPGVRVLCRSCATSVAALSAGDATAACQARSAFCQRTWRSAGVRHRNGTGPPKTGGMSDTASAPASPAYDVRRGLASAGAALFLGFSQGLGLQLVNTNLPAVQGSLDASAAEAAWLSAAYFSAA